MLQRADHIAKISSFSKTRSLGVSLSFKTNINRKLPAGSVNVQNQLIPAFVAKPFGTTFRSFSSTSKLFQEQARPGLRPRREDTPEEAHIKSLLFNKDYQGVEDYFKALSANTQDLSGSIYTAYLKALSYRGALRQMYQVMEDYKNLERNARLGDRFRVGTGMHLAFLRAYRQRGTVSWTYWERLDGQAKSPVLYQELVEQYAEKNVVEKTSILLEEMKEKGFRMTPLTFIASVKAFGNRRLVDKILSTAAQAKLDGIPSDIRFYRPVITALSKAGSVEEILKQFEEMKAADITPDLTTYNSLISAYATKGDTAQAQQVLDTIKSKDLTPNEFTFANLLKSYVKKEDLPGLIEQFEKIKGVVAPSTFSYNVMLGALKGKDDAAFNKYLKEMTETGIPQNDSTKKILTDGEQPTEITNEQPPQ